MPAPSGHIHVSERQPGSDLDCLWQAYIEFHRQAKNPATPATHAEGDALRAASGDTGTSNIGNLRLGVKRRYNMTLPASIAGFEAIWAALELNTVAVLLGKYTGWPAGSHWRRFYPTYTGGHAVFGYRFDTSDAIWWCDPGGPQTGYSGEVMSKADLKRYIDAGAGFSGSLVLPIITEVDMVPIADPTPRVADLPAGTDIYHLDKTRSRAAGTDLPGRYVAFRSDGTFSALQVKPNPSELELVKTAALRNVRPYVDCTAAVAAAVAPLNARIVAAKVALG